MTMEPRSCKDCKQEFVPRAAFEIRCFPCWLAAVGQSPAASSDVHQAGSPAVGGNKVFTWGKHRGKSFQDVFANDKGWVAWVRSVKDPSGMMQEFLDFINSQEQATSRSRSRTPPRRPIQEPGSSEKQSPGCTEGDGAQVITFGKYTGRTFQDVFDTDKSYVAWTQKQENTTGQMSQFIEFVRAKLIDEAAEHEMERKRKFEEWCERDALRREEEKRQAEEREAERMRRIQEWRQREEVRLAQQRKLAEEVECMRQAARTAFQIFLMSKFEEYKGGYQSLKHFEQLATGYDPFGDIIRQYGDTWMLTPNHKNYHALKDNWDPRKILEWGQTYYEKYSLDAKPEAVQCQQAAVELMLKQSCLLVKPHVKRMIYWELQNKHRTFSRDIERVFGNIFTDLQMRAGSHEAPVSPPTHVQDSPPADFFGDKFTWSWEWPVELRVAIACKYYMWKRSDCEKGKESLEASDRRILLIQMLLALTESGDIQAFPNEDGSDILYRRPRGSTYILVEAPDEGAVHVFDRPKGCSDTEHRERIFAFFRHFNSLVTRKITLSDGSQVYAKVGDVEELPEDFVAAKLAENTKAHKNKVVLDAHPVLKAGLVDPPPQQRPSLQEFLGWRMIITHRKQELTKAVFEDAVGVSLKQAKAAEAQAIAEIKEARRKAGEGDALGGIQFRGGSWH